MDPESNACESDYEEVYKGLASSSKIISENNIIVVKDDNTRQFSAAKLSHEVLICGRKAWASSTQDIFYLFTDTERT